MGTNFYIRKQINSDEYDELKDAIEGIGYDFDGHIFNRIKDKIFKRVHIGKRSGGWRFLFNHNDWEYYETIDELKEFINSYELIDEYNNTIDPKEFWEDVERREKDPEMLDSKRYKERWYDIHPRDAMPDYMFFDSYGDIIVEGYTFSKSIWFC